LTLLLLLTGNLTDLFNVLLFHSISYHSIQLFSDSIVLLFDDDIDDDSIHYCIQLTIDDDDLILTSSEYTILFDMIVHCQYSVTIHSLTFEEIHYSIYFMMTIQ